MILDNFRQYVYIKRKVKEDIELIYKKLEIIRKHGSLLVICPKPTGYNWKGVNLATKNLFNNHTFEIAQYYSNPVYNIQEIKQIVSFIVNLNFSQIIFSGFPDYFEQIVEEVYFQNKKIIMGVIFYGYLHEMKSEKNSEMGFIRIQNLLKNQKIKKIGFNKKGLSETINRLSGLSTSYIMVKNPNVNYVPKMKDMKTEFNIGVLGDNSFRKNLDNQVAASLLIPNSIVHVIEKPEFNYFGQNERIIGLGKISNHQNYLDALANMKLNLYASYSESWGLVTTDSLSMGVPCLIGKSASVYDWDDDLKEALTVLDYDNPIAISEQIEYILSLNIDSNKLKSYVRKLNTIADELMTEFIDK